MAPDELKICNNQPKTTIVRLVVAYLHQEAANFSMGAISAPKTRGPNAVRASPGAGRLYEAHGEPRRRDSVPWWMSPWRERAKPLVVSLGGSGSLVLCVVVVCVRRGAKTGVSVNSLFIFGNGKI